MKRLLPAVITGLIGTIIVVALLRAFELGSAVAAVLLVGLTAIIMYFALPPDLSGQAPNRINRRI